ncbi:hypothetical protein JOC76_001709 [Neobacillus cucumis]|nr:hypothetical protein [Neobacillus cucumis]
MRHTPMERFWEAEELQGAFGFPLTKHQALSQVH